MKKAVDLAFNLYEDGKRWPKPFYTLSRDNHTVAIKNS